MLQHGMPAKKKKKKTFAYSCCQQQSRVVLEKIAKVG
jgi:hypothetical protein